MLAQAGANIGQQIGSGYANLGRDITSGLMDISGAFRERRQQKEAQELLEKYKDDPAQLNALYQKYAAEKNPLAELFSQAAQKAVQAQSSAAMGSAIGGMASQDVNAMLQAAQALAKIPGMEQQAISMIEAANRLKKEQQGDEQTNNLRSSTAMLAEELGLPELAKQVRQTTDLERLQKLNDKLLEKQMEKMPELDQKTRRQVLLGVGYTPQFVGTLDLKNMSKQEFQAYKDLQKGDVEGYLTPEGDIVAYRTTESGMVVVDGELKDPAQLGLKEAPSQQVIKNATSTMGNELARLGAEDFFEAGQQAQKSAESIISIDNVMGDIDAMFTGSLANVNLQVQKFMKSVGIPVDDLKIANTEVFQAESAKRVADYITNLGAGTGLSDKDLEFTRKVVAGDVTLDANTIRTMLNEFREASIRKIERYNKLFDKVSSKVDEGAMVAYDKVLVPPKPKTTDYSGYSIATE